MEKEKNQLLIPIAIVIAGGLIALALFFASRHPVAQTDTRQQQQQATEATPPSREELLRGAITLGNPDAPVLMVEFADYQCPFCGKFFKESAPFIIEQYVKKGTVLFAYRDFPFLGDESEYAAEAAQCANEQQKFWQYHDYVYTYMWDTYYGQNKSGENVGALSKDHLKQFAGTLGLDTAAFNQCLDSGRYSQSVADSVARGRAAGVSGTPAFFINGQKFTGALPVQQFVSAIESELAPKK